MRTQPSSQGAGSGLAPPVAASCAQEQFCWQLPFPSVCRWDLPGRVLPNPVCSWKALGSVCCGCSACCSLHPPSAAGAAPAALQKQQILPTAVPPCFQLPVELRAGYTSSLTSRGAVEVNRSVFVRRYLDIRMMSPGGSCWWWVQSGGRAGAGAGPAVPTPARGVVVRKLQLESDPRLPRLVRELSLGPPQFPVELR